MAAKYLTEQGYVVLEKNLFTPYGEIDLIAKEGETLVFTEIKYRKTKGFGDGLQAVDCRKQMRISKSALYYYTYHGYEEQRSCRFDVIAILGDGELTHIKNAFEYMGG
ncbi:MAG: YraN family protein [Lachnospiraceae bacterium]|nr:YraN family protein [Lachnospiraceae bacterium]